MNKANLELAWVVTISVLFIGGLLIPMSITLWIWTIKQALAS